MADVRIATFNASLNRSAAGELVADLWAGANTQAQSVAEIIQKTDADIILLNEFDFDPAGEAARLFSENYLKVSQNGATALDYGYVYVASSNTGLVSGFDLDNDGVTATEADVGTAQYANDAFGFGTFPGQFGFVIYSKHEILTEEIRTFQNFLWKDMPGNLLTNDPTVSPLDEFYSRAEIDALPLSSKNHVDVPVLVDGEVVHVLAAHPTPPVFDGEEDRNGKRNHDEIRFWKDYANGADYITDDAGKTGGLTAGERFVILGDYNADPFDGDSYDGAVDQLLDDGTINGSATDPYTTPGGPGGAEQALVQAGPNASHAGNPRFDTGDFGFSPATPGTDVAPGNLRVDYVLPSREGFAYLGGGVFWPESGDPDFGLTSFPTSDHRLVYADLLVTDDDRTSVAGVEFAGEASFPTGLQFEGTEVGGLSGLSYDAANGTYVAISDDRSQFGPARFYTLTVDLSVGALGDGDVAFAGVTTLTDADGDPFPALSLDPEGIAIGPSGTLYVSSEGDANALLDPFVRRFDAAGRQIAELPVDDRFSPAANQSSGIRNNLAFESLALTPDQRTLYTATENALFQDGPAATMDSGSLSRIVAYDVASGEAVAEYGYLVDPVAAESVPAGQFTTNGLVELLALDNEGTLLALERGFSTGVGNTLRLYEVRTQGATNLIGEDSVPTAIDDGELEANVDALVSKELLIDFADLGITLDNVEGMTFGPDLADGRRSLVLVSDNNFSATQETQFLSFALDLDRIPTIDPVAETPDEIRFEDGIETDPDDPAIWFNAADPEASVVITAMKNGGARVYDLAGNELQRIVPEGIRYNNVDLVYGIKIGGEARDLAVFSDRANDTLAFYAIGTDGLLTDVTAPDVRGQMFGVDDGEQTAYGLATYSSLRRDRDYVFVTEADGARIAQLKIVVGEDGTVGFRKIRTLDLAVPAGEDPADFQAEGIAIDRETGIGYVAVEGELGLLTFSAEPNGPDTFDTVASIDEDYLEPDIEGVSIYYGRNGTGLILVSSQGDSTYAAFDRSTGAYLGSFALGAADGIDGVEESDGSEIYSGALPGFERGLLVTQDGSNDPAAVFPDPDDGEIQNFNANFKFTDLGDVLDLFGVCANADFDPRALAPQTLPNGVGSGDVSEDSAILWVRSTVPGRVIVKVWQVAEDGARTRVARIVTEVTDPDVPVKVAVDGLESGNDYIYRLVDDAGATKAGRFSTAHEDGFAGLSFGIAGDWRGDLAPYPAIANAVDAGLDFFVQGGDTIYADFVTPSLGRTTDLDGYRTKYQEVYGTRDRENFWAELRQSTPVFAVIDDHEVINDFAGGAPAASDPRLGATDGFVNDTEAFEAGLRAFQEYHPIEDRFTGDTGDDRTAFERDVYRFQAYGDDAALFVLDQRSFRDEQIASATGSTDPAVIGRFVVDSFDPDRTLLGEAQLERLKADLLTAEANGVTWKAVFAPEPIQLLGLYSGDSWDGYRAERTELLKFIADNDIDNVVFVAADIHATFVNNLSYSEGPGQAEIATSAFEITTGSVAFAPPFGESVVETAAAGGLLTPAQVAFYDSLPIAPDTDDIANDKDDFIKQAFNEIAIAPAGLDPLGLDDNLPEADGLIDATLLAGDYVAAHTFGWTEFDIDAETQVLTVTTWGIPGYTPREIAADPRAVLDREPAIVSQFAVTPSTDAEGAFV